MTGAHISWPKVEDQGAARFYFGSFAITSGFIEYTPSSSP